MRQTIQHASRGLLPVLVISCTLAADAGATSGSGRHVEHALTVSLDPPSHRLVVSDSIRFPERPADGGVEFVLNGALRLRRSDPPAREVPLGEGRAFFGINSGGGADPERRVGLKRYRLVLPPGRSTLVLSYDGVIDVGLSDAREQYTRGFRETAGRVGPEGVYLAGSSVWYPSFDRGLLEFTIDVRQPAGWHVISQGNGTSRDTAGHARWESGGAMDEIYLVGGPLQVFRDTVGTVETLVYLHERDEAIASKYLAATAQYIDMYRRLIGPYPYGKFALVENFWETGYGMPTFTLLGREIIRFPFIINSSYPHEILHNWWGNSVLVEYERGNWCEGLTAYLADHLIQEQRGTDSEYRRATLQKYRDYVKAGRDLPLTAFRSRHSAATEAVGYGKALMGFHALRLALGDEAFRRALARFYREFKGRRAAFSDIRATMESVSGRDLGRFFSEWTERTGAPVLAIEQAVVGGVAPGPVEREHAPQGRRLHRISAVLRQVQDGPPFALDVPIVVQTATGAVRRTVHLEGAERAFTIDTPDLPLALQVDPYFDVFRKLDPRETPPSIGQIFGEPRALAILPSTAPRAELQAWRELFTSWTSDSHAIETRLDTEVAELPADRAVWIAGRTNAWAGRVFRGRMAGGSGGGEIDGQAVPPAASTIVLTARHPGNAERAVGWLSVDPLAAFPGLARKLPHYGKYSYLAFEGEEPVNVLKGQWQPSDSPLRLLLSSAAAGAVAALPPDRRKPLAELPPVFSEEALTAHVAFLAAPEREGRMPGSAGHEAAAEYIAGRFKALGLAPGGDEGGYMQRFTMTGPGGGMLRAANVIGVMGGSRVDWRRQAVLVTAHYDHLGTGWPDVHQGDTGKVHPGADDNASGVAVLLELARVLAAAEEPARTIVFVAFSGEEAGRIGSTFYAAHPGRFPLADTIGVINIDTVGRLGPAGVSVLAAETATEWPHIFRGASYVTGVESRMATGAIESSDQASFIERGVPAVQIFTGAHADYHRPSDTADKVEAPALVKVATFVREAVSYLAERPDALTVTIKTRQPGDARGAATGEGGAAGPPPGGGGTRRVSFGTVPDFGFGGPGVRVSSVVAASPAEKAGVVAGDVLISVDGKPVADLRRYADILRTLSPGQTVSAIVVRDGREVALKVTLAER